MMMGGDDGGGPHSPEGPDGQQMADASRLPTHAPASPEATPPDHRAVSFADGSGRGGYTLHDE